MSAQVAQRPPHLRRIARLSRDVEPHAFHLHGPVGAHARGDLREDRACLLGPGEVALQLSELDLRLDVVAVVLELSRCRLELHDGLIPQAEVDQRVGSLAEQTTILREVVDVTPFRIIGIPDLCDGLIGNGQGGSCMVPARQCVHQDRLDAQRIGATFILGLQRPDLPVGSRLHIESLGMHGDHGVETPVGADVHEDLWLGDASGYVGRFGEPSLLDEQKHQIAPRGARLDIPR